jgi:hypothetical protein
MNGYEPSIPRVTFGIVAVAMTAMTLAVLVLLPAEIRVYDDPTSTLSAIVATASAGIGASATSAKLDSLVTPVAASVPCIMVDQDHAQEM